MATYRISEAAHRAGFSPSALRYYENVGLVVPERSSSGYRVYDERQVAKLRFLAEAKALGVTLEEARGLLARWEEDACGTVADELRRLLTVKVSEALGKADELRSFTDRLRTVAACLEEVPLTAQSGEDCACIGLIDGAENGGRESQRGPTPSPEPAIACSVHVDDQDGRVEEWRRVTTRAREDRSFDGGRVLRFDPGTVDVATLGTLMADEQECCTFFDFTLRLTASDVTLEIRVPEGAGTFVEAILGPAA